MNQLPKVLGAILGFVLVAAALVVVVGLCFKFIQWAFL